MGPQFFVDGGFVCTYKGITRLLGRGSVRITPAHVGKRRLPDVQKHKARDHPRTRGEKLSLQLLSAASLGSPPRMRGKDDLLAAPRLGGGITPAHAGKSLSFVGIGTCLQDHPRACGEKGYGSCGAGLVGGSPPRVRGKGTGDAAYRVGVGITPARAGKSHRCTSLQKRFRDHPRACGEKSHTTFTSTPLMGSPPRVRGKVGHLSQAGPQNGITPARAGKRLNGSRI